MCREDWLRMGKKKHRCNRTLCVLVNVTCCVRETLPNPHVQALRHRMHATPPGGGRISFTQPQLDSGRSCVGVCVGGLSAAGMLDGGGL